MAEIINNEQADMMQNGGRTLAEQVFHFDMLLADAVLNCYINLSIIRRMNDYDNLRRNKNRVSYRM